MRTDIPNLSKSIMPIDPTRPSSDYTTYVRERADIVKRGTLDFSSSLFKSAAFASAYGGPIEFKMPKYVGYYMEITSGIGFYPTIPIPGTSFTLEWVMRKNNPTTRYFEIIEFSGNGNINSTDNPNIGIYMNNTEMIIDLFNKHISLPSAAAPFTDTWSHYAITFTSEKTEIFFNGKKVLSDGNAGIWHNIATINIVNDLDTLVYATNIRLSNTVLYTTDFVPTLPLTINSSTKFLVDKEVPADWDYGDPITLIGPIEIGSS